MGVASVNGVVPHSLASVNAKRLFANYPGAILHAGTPMRCRLSGGQKTFLRISYCFPRGTHDSIYRNTIGGQWQKILMSGKGPWR